MKKNQGFTLIELLVVIAIIGILASIVLTSLSNARVKANTAAFKSEAASLLSAGVMQCDNAAANAVIALPTFKSITVAGATCSGDGIFSMTATPKSAGKGGDCTQAVVNENGPTYTGGAGCTN